MRPALQIAIIDGALPDTFNALRAEARIEGYAAAALAAKPWHCLAGVPGAG